MIATKRWKLLDGTHIENVRDDKGEIVYEGRNENKKPKTKMHRAGDVFDSPEDLSQFNPKRNAQGLAMPPKFQEVQAPDELPAGAALFDPSKETLDQFIARVKPMQVGMGVADNKPSSPSTPLKTDLKAKADKIKGMSLKDLIDFAAEEEIDLKGQTKDRNKVLQIIEAELLQPA